MGTYFNPGNDSFRRAVNSKIYVDKTGLLELLNENIYTETNCIALSHARRFGKSQAAGMIDAYYSKGCDSRELFSKFEIAEKLSFEKHMNKYNVIHLDMSSISDSFDADVLGETKRRLVKDFKEAFGENIDYTQPTENILNDICKMTNVRFVIIIDEWDCVVRNYPKEDVLVHKYMQFLHSLFKSEESKTFLALGYITGILPIKKIRDESALNNFREYTMINSRNLTPYFGFTEDEVKTLCKKYNMDFETISLWYDGYRINGLRMYNPNSVVQAMYDGCADSYWRNTSSFQTINDLIFSDYAGLKDDIVRILGGEEITVDTTTFANDLSQIACKDDVFTALIHLGYLGWNAETQTVCLPNYEVATAYQSALKSDQWGKISKAIRQCDKLLKATIAKDAECVAKILDDAHSAYSSILKYNDENALACAVTMVYFTAPQYYKIVRELPAGKGFADFAFIPLKNSNKPPMIIELKYDKSADSAIRQIKEKRYHGSLEGLGNEILLVGINYNKENSNRKHTCIIESISSL